MQYFDLKVAPNGMREIQVQGNYIYFLEGSAGGADATLSLRKGAGSDSILLKPGQAIKLPDAGGYDTRWIISNYRNQGTIIGTLLIGDGEFSDNRISGSVEVIDGGKNRTKADVAFMLNYAVTPAAGEMAHIELFNPVGSAVNLVVESFLVGSTTASGARARSHNAEIANLYAKGVSKYLETPIAQSKGELRYQSSVGAIGAAVNMWSTELQANVTIPHKPTEPYVIAPGMGLIVTNGLAAAALNASFEWFEEAINS
jgi:hypothetical protein